MLNIHISKGQKAHSTRMLDSVILCKKKKVRALHGFIKHMEILCQTTLTENKMISKYKNMCSFNNQTHSKHAFQFIATCSLFLKNF